jgi:Rrf2 family protein
MKISTKGRYALKVMIDLANHNNGDYIALKDIANRQDVPVKYLEQIVSALGKAGYLQSMRGGGGGHKLAKAPKDYIVGDILRTMEGPLAPTGCTADRKGIDCPLSEDCSTVAFWRGLDKVINEYVDSFTLQDLI